MTATLTHPAHHRSAAALLKELVELRDAVRDESEETLARWGLIERRAFRLSARNFAAYLAFRRRDLRRLQLDLMPYGLSSFGRSEARVFANFDAVIGSLQAINGLTARYPHARAFFRGERLLHRNTAEMFGIPPKGRYTRIMVTLPSEAAADAELVERLVASGMDCARVNCAHDDAAAWRAMAEHVRSAEKRTGRSCKVCFDLAGPKVRTLAILLPQPDHRLKVGDLILFAEEIEPERSGFPVQFTCTIPTVLHRLEAGTPIWINDGKIGCVVEKCASSHAVLRVTHARPKGEHLRAEKGLNFPTVSLPTASLTHDDVVNLAEVVSVADMIGYSFVRRAQDVVDLQNALAELKKPAMPLVLKIETAQAVANLPELIVAAARRNPAAVMIARGDLAVEIEYRRLAEIQEEMLWLCEAAHVPVIWATEVLDRFIKDGKPSRAEFTDAAASGRADCVMLNKGPFLAEAIGVLNDVLIRMEAHQSKKTSLLRALKTWSPKR